MEFVGIIISIAENLKTCFGFNKNNLQSFWRGKKKVFNRQLELILCPFFLPKFLTSSYISEISFECKYLKVVDLLNFVLENQKIFFIL